MVSGINNRSKKYWGRKASYCLFCTWNCSEATVQTTQDMLSRQDDVLIMASAGLEGGVVSSGSTCGVVSGGALSLALMHDGELVRDGFEAEVGLQSIVADYVNWFQGKYGTTKCRERSGVNLWTLGGLIRYLIPPDAILRCLSHINGAMQYLFEKQGNKLPNGTAVSGVSTGAGTITNPIHCAQRVLERVRERTGVGDPLLERASVAFDGGIGLHGGACGALAGAVMAVNIPMGINLRDASIIEAIRAFFSGEKFLRNDNPTKIDEPYDVGKRIVMQFREAARSIDCSTITGERFLDYASFQRHMSSSDVCHRLIDLSVDEAVFAIKEYQRSQ
jgi:hypothetical protein